MGRTREDNTEKITKKTKHMIEINLLKHDKEKNAAER